MQPTDGDVGEFLAVIGPAKRKRDADSMVEVMRGVTGEQPRLWGTIIGFGQYHYRYESVTEGDAPGAGFSPRKAATTIYFPEGVGVYKALLAELGPHTTGKGCLYIKDLEEVDLGVLTKMISQSYARVTAGTVTDRAQ